MGNGVKNRQVIERRLAFLEARIHAKRKLGQDYKPDAIERRALLWALAKVDQANAVDEAVKTGNVTLKPFTGPFGGAV